MYTTFLAEGDIDVFIPKPDEILWSAVVLVILGVAFYKFFLPKINQVLEARSEKIEGGIAEAGKLKNEAMELHEKYTAEIKGARLEAARIQDEARASAAQIIQDAKVKATQDAELISKNASRAIETERKAAAAQLKKQVGSLAMAMTQKMLNNGLENSERQSRMIDNSIDHYTAADRKNAPRSGSRSNRDANSESSGEKRISRRRRVTR
ncbi:MAG: F0F1 ATP synthase subunit B [Candidatus Ancillula sp.]|jgi:F-type H+-transporting ATPase subunit b|nr:F0F1 ATP synthase subunit B [Candidatus Ancillula sp.]